ncbi:hypothetical protein BASU183_03305 [Bacillus subtilis]
MLSASSSKYDMIMKASVSLFTERGFDATTIPMIAERAHVGTGTIYRYFDSKETLVNVLFQESIQRFTEKLKQDVSELPVREGITSMLRALKEAMNQSKRLGLQDKMMVKTKLQFQKDIEVMNSLVDRMIAERKANPDENIKDLLSLMLYAKDPVTGETLDDENIRYQIITFLIAGHETTSGLLSFAIYCLLTHPEKLKKAQEEADRVLTDDTPEYKQIQQLKYIRMVLNETLRLYPTAPAFSLYAKEDTVLGGEYPISKGQPVTVLIPKLHRDQNAWGPDAEDFRPERFEDPSSIPHHAYKPFGNGQRACIGMQFALQEATMVLGLVLKHFELINHTGYELKIKEALTIKPDDFKITVKPRKTAAINVQRKEQADIKAETKPKETKPKHGTPLLVLYGSNLGTAEGIAGELAAQGRSRPPDGLYS